MKKVKISKEYLRKIWSESGRGVRINANYYIVYKEDGVLMTEEQNIMWRFLSWIYFILWFPVIILFILIQIINKMIDYFLDNSDIMPKLYTLKKVLRWDELSKEYAQQLEKEGKIK